MTAILPAGVSAMLVRYAIDRERDAKLFRGAGCVGRADAAEREARRARDIIAAHDEALAQRADSLDAHRRAFAEGLRGVFPEANLEGAV